MVIYLGEKMVSCSISDALSEGGVLFTYRCLINEHCTQSKNSTGHTNVAVETIWDKQYWVCTVKLGGCSCTKKGDYER